MGRLTCAPRCLVPGPPQVNLSLEPQLSHTWLASMAFVSKILQLDLAAIYAQGLLSNSQHSVVDLVLPKVATNTILNHGIQHTSPLVVYTTLQTLCLLLRRVDDTVKALALVTDTTEAPALILKRLKHAARKRFPDFQTLLTLRHKAFQGAFKQSDLLQRAVIATIEAFCKLSDVLGSARVDVGRFIQVCSYAPTPTTAPQKRAKAMLCLPEPCVGGHVVVVCRGMLTHRSPVVCLWCCSAQPDLGQAPHTVQSAVVSLLATCAYDFRWWDKPKGGNRTHIWSLLSMYAAATDAGIVLRCQELLTRLFFTTELFAVREPWLAWRCPRAHGTSGRNLGLVLGLGWAGSRSEAWVVMCVQAGVYVCVRVCVCVCKPECERGGHSVADAQTCCPRRALARRSASG